MDVFTAGEVAKQLGILYYTLDYLEWVGKIPAAERTILRETLIEIDCKVKQADKMLAKMEKRIMQSTVFLYNLRNDAKMARDILREIPPIKKKLLKNLKMPEMDE